MHYYGLGLHCPLHDSLCDLCRKSTVIVQNVCFLTVTDVCRQVAVFLEVAVRALRQDVRAGIYEYTQTNIHVYNRSHSPHIHKPTKTNCQPLLGGKT